MQCPETSLITAATIVQGIASAVMNGESTIFLRMEVLLKFTNKEVVIWMTLTIGDLVNREVAEHEDRYAVLWDKSDYRRHHCA